MDGCLLEMLATVPVALVGDMTGRVMARWKDHVGRCAPATDATRPETPSHVRISFHDSYGLLLRQCHGHAKSRTIPVPRNSFSSRTVHCRDSRSVRHTAPQCRPGPQVDAVSSCVKLIPARHSAS